MALAILIRVAKAVILHLTLLLLLAVVEAVVVLVQVLQLVKMAVQVGDQEVRQMVLGQGLAIRPQQLQAKEQVAVQAHLTAAVMKVVAEVVVALLVVQGVMLLLLERRVMVVVALHPIFLALLRFTAAAAEADTQIMVLTVAVAMVVGNLVDQTFREQLILVVVAAVQTNQ